MSLDALGNFLPELALLATGVVVVGVGAFIEESDRRRTASTAIALVGIAIALARVLLLISTSYPAIDQFSGTFVLDHYAIYIKAVLLVFAAVTVLITHRFADTVRPHQSEFIGLVLLATVGGMFMASAREMIELYVSLETLSISLYVMVAFNKRVRLSSEAGFKYLIVGAASSAVLLYGLAILYGLTGRTNLEAVARAISASGTSSPALVVAALFVVGGLSFKIAAVPFHQWVPDVYQGAPTPVTAFVAVSSKTAGYGLLIRVLTSALQPAAHQWALYLAIVAAVTMTVGNISALNQTSVKRLLGYSSIAHAGYLIMGLVAMANSTTAVLGLGALLFYLLVYGLTNLAAFGALESAELSQGSDELSAMTGLKSRAGGVALVEALAMLSLTGIPPLAGFFAKAFIFLAAIAAGYSWLALIALANSALSAVYYMRVVRAMYSEEEKPAPAKPMTVGPAMWTALGAGVAGMLPLVIFASPLIDRAQDAAHAIFSR